MLGGVEDPVFRMMNMGDISFRASPRAWRFVNEILAETPQLVAYRSHGGGRGHLRSNLLEEPAIGAEQRRLGSSSCPDGEGEFAVDHSARRLEKQLRESNERTELLMDDVETLMEYVARQHHEVPTDEQRFPWVAIDDQCDKTQIAETLCERWLGAYMNEDVLPGERLAAYRIEQIELVDKEPTGTEQAEFVFHVTFSVRPVVASIHSWAAGNGTSGEDGWFINKGLFAMVLKEGRRYRLRLIGTGL